MWGTSHKAETTQAEKEVTAKDYFNEGETLAGELKVRLKGSDTNIEVAKQKLNEITSENVAYVVKNFENIAEEIDDVFDWGNGFDKKDVYNHVLSKLIQRFDELGYKERIEEIKSEPWAIASSYEKAISVIEGKESAFSENSSLEDMVNAIKFYSSVILEYKDK